MMLAEQLNNETNRRAIESKAYRYIPLPPITLSSLFSQLSEERAPGYTQNKTSDNLQEEEWVNEIQTNDSRTTDLGLAGYGDFDSNDANYLQKIFEALPNNTHVTSLYLQDTPFDLFPPTLLAALINALKHNRGIEHLNITNTNLNKLSPTIFAELVDTFKVNNIKTLSIHMNHLNLSQVENIKIAMESKGCKCEIDVLNSYIPYPRVTPPNLFRGSPLPETVDHIHSWRPRF